nr:MAG TPA: Protein of unknown function (DUF3641) [Caudoviricetes sp.]
MRRAVAPGRKSLQSRPPESLTKPGAYPGRGIYAAPRCERRGRICMTGRWCYGCTADG